MRHILILACLPLLALDNSKTLNNLTTGAITSRAQTLHFYLAQGEITNFPRPYLTPSDTGTRAAAANWQADVKQRWRDGSSQRSITGVLSGPVVWATGGAGLNSCTELNDVATCTFSAAHGLSAGNRLVISGATGDLDWNRDHYTVVSVPSPTTVTINTQNVSNGTVTNAGLTVTSVVEPAGAGLCRIKSPNHRLEVSEQVTIAEIVGVLNVNGTHRVTAVSQDEFLINTTCSGTFISGGYVIGPDFGSVKAALVSFTAGVPASGSLRVDIVNSTDPCHLGDAATCRAAGLDKAGMLAFNGGTWDASLALTANVKSGSTAAISRSARTMLTDWAGVESYCGPRYLQLGPVVTKMVVEFYPGCATTSVSGNHYDLGWKIVPGTTLAEAITSTSQTQFNVASAANLAVGSRLWFRSGSNPYPVELMDVTAIVGNTLTVTRGYDSSTPRTHVNGLSFGVLQWEDATGDGFRGIHPSFALTFNAGWAGVKIETRLENTYYNKQSGTWYTVGLTVGGVARLATGEMKHPPRTRWRKTFWSGDNAEYFCYGGAGTDPDACSTSGGGGREMVVRVDHNTDYLTYAKAIPAYPRNPSNVDSYAWWNGVSAAGYRASDFGSIGVARDASSIRYLGQGTFGSDSRSYAFAEKDLQTGSAEGWPLARPSASWIQNWDIYGYDQTFGVQSPGGGGNTAVEGHIPYMMKEDTARAPYVAGWPDSPIGRWVSTHVRAGMATTPANMFVGPAIVPDTPKLACWTTAGVDYGSTIGNTSDTWPCGAGAVAGNDGWNWELAHMNEWNWLAWVITGDDWHAQQLMAKGALAGGYGHSAFGRNIGKIWAWSMTVDLTRHESWGTQAMIHAWNVSPTELLYGQITTPERNLYGKYVWDASRIQEGVSNVTDGWEATLYGPLFSAVCTGYSSALGSNQSYSPYRYGRCGIGQPSNPLGYSHPYIALGGCTATTANCTVTNSQHPFSMFNGTAVAWRQGIDMGHPGYQYAWERLGKFAINAALNADMDQPYVGAVSANPIRFTATGTIAQTWAQWRTGYSATAIGYRNFAALGGSMALSLGTSWRYLSLLSQFTDLSDTTTEGCQPAKRPPVGCTGEQAWQWIRGTAINELNAFNEEPRYYTVPRPRITNVTASWSAGTASLSWVAPSGAGCTVGFNPVNSLDTGESTATAVGRIQTFSGATTAGSTYRISCGQARYTGNL